MKSLARQLFFGEISSRFACPPNPPDGGAGGNSVRPKAGFS